MSYNYPKPRTLSIPAGQIEPSTDRDPISSRLKYISWCPPNTTSHEHPLTELSSLNDIKQGKYIPSRFREADLKEEDLNSTINFSKENLNVDADDMFDNFDDCFQVRFQSQESTVSHRSQDLKALPVCRDLLSEFAADSTSFTSGISGVKTPLSFGSYHSHKPHEFLVHKAEMYFDMNTPRDVQLQNNLQIEGMARSKSNQNVKLNIKQGGMAPRPDRKVQKEEAVYEHEEDVGNEDEGIAQKNVKNFMDLRNKNYDSEERPTIISQPQRHTHKDIPITRLVLNDVTNNIPRYRKGSMHDGGDSSRLSTADILTKRKLAERETVEENRRNSVIQNTYNKTRKISISELFSSLRTKENHYVPSARSSYNGRGEDNKARSILERPKSVCKEIPNNNKTQNKVRVSVERQSIKAENSQNGAHTGRKAYDTLIRYFEIAKQGFTGSSNKNTGRSTSVNRK